MATLTIDRTKIRLIKPIIQWPDLPSGEAFTEGQYVRINTTTGKWEFGNATTSGEVGNIRGIAISRGAVAAAVTVIKEGILDMGEALASLAYGATVYLSDTDGTLADAAGTVSTVVGYVFPLWGATTPDKVLYVKL